MVAVPVSQAVAAPSAPSAPRATADGRPFELAALDGVPLAARLFMPGPAGPAGPARAAALIVPAMGVAQAFYGQFASWLASIGVIALTFDYRGTGLSRRGSLRGLTADIVDWARLDTTAALRALEDIAPGLPLHWIGHSLGAQIVPFVPDHRELAKIVTIAAGSGYWRENSPPARHLAWFLWQVATPILTPLFGYFPGKWFHMIGDLPAGVIWQWRRWCLDPEYAVGAEGPSVRQLYTRVTAPITSLSFSDDEMMSARNTESLHGFYIGARVTLRRIAPADVGLPRIGHFGFFRAAARAALWDGVLGDELVGR